ncbi:MAG: heme ABC exporter ATP-binding protein CcmA [Rhizobiales bacterium TMED168]|nr:MAG: heme ABC exporter ATP-binding protein CcmA [Rhizobiales bacterium TMED168]|tara:strand:+ start:108537 stop:109136 length:600 start_codon:yes stop_codon:yes gene_type:complete
MTIDMKGLNVSNISCIRSGNEIFKNISFSLINGQVGLLTGSNGSGKTTLLRVLAGLIPNEYGSIKYNNKNLKNNFSILGHKIGIKDEITPNDDLLFWSSIYGFNNFEDVLEKVNLLKYRNLKCKYLSQGQKQRLAIARLIISQKLLWFLDEPLSSLDKEGISLLKNIIRSHTESEGIVLLSSHSDFLTNYDLEIDMDKE